MSLSPSCLKNASREGKGTDKFSSSKETSSEIVRHGLLLVQRSELTKDDKEKADPFTLASSVEISTDASDTSRVPASGCKNEAFPR